MNGGEGPAPEENEAAPTRLREGEDYYWEGPYMVFTAAYHRKRGYCCGSGCRHCPYREIEDETERFS